MATEMTELKRPAALFAEYRGKFPEISEDVLAQIIREHGSDRTTCQKVLEEESRKCLYGCLTTPESPVSLPNALIVLTPKTIPATNTSSFIRSNSSGSTNSSGRSTPVSQIPTPWVVPRYHSSTSPSNIHPPGQQQTSPSEGYPPSSDNTQVTNPGSTVVPSRIYQTSPNIGYPLANTNGNFLVRTGTPTSSSHGTQAIMHPLLTNGAQGTYTMPNANLGPADPRYHILSGSSPCDPGTVNSPNVGVRIGTPYFVPNTVPVQSLVPNLGQLYIRTNEPGSGEISQYLVNSNPTQFNPLHQTAPETVISTNVPRNDAPYLTTNAGFVPINILGSPNTDQHYDLSSKTDAHNPVVRQQQSPGILTSHPEDALDSSASGPISTESQQREANDKYLTACLSRQLKRFQNLEKERGVEKERLELLIQGISDRDVNLSNQKYRVAPNPTDEQVHRLTEENKQLNKTIDEISKNVDRLDNGQGVLPPPNPQVYHSQRIYAPNHEGSGAHFDRSNSVPYIPVQKPEHPLQHQLSEQNLQYTLTPSSLEDWSMINAQHLPIPIPANNDEDQQWNCSKCTYLNHEILIVCEMCGSNRTGS